MKREGSEAVSTDSSVVACCTGFLRKWQELEGLRDWASGSAKPGCHRLWAPQSCGRVGAPKSLHFTRVPGCCQCCARGPHFENHCCRGERKGRAPEQDPGADRA